MRRISFCDPETGKRLVFLTNNFVLPAETIAALYKKRWQVELFFKWIKQNLRIKHFYGTSENAVKTQIWTAVCVYVLAAIIKRELALNVSLNTFLQILSVHSFEKIELFRAFQEVDTENPSPQSNNQLNLLRFLTGRQWSNIHTIRPLNRRPEVVCQNKLHSLALRRQRPGVRIPSGAPLFKYLADPWEHLVCRGSKTEAAGGRLLDSLSHFRPCHREDVAWPHLGIRVADVAQRTTLPRLGSRVPSYYNRVKTSRVRSSSATAQRLPDAGLRRSPAGQSRDLPVPLASLMSYVPAWMRRPRRLPSMMANSTI